MNGSSPRTRGTLRTEKARPSNERFIPAYTGNTPGRPPCSSRAPVHPRVHGEHVELILVPIGRDGSSPRTRGTRARPARRTPHQRFIPAYTGNTTCARATAGRSTVHPRVHGEHGPRHQAGPDRPRFIPAYTGNTMTPLKGGPVSAVHPRVHGEHVDGTPTQSGSFGSSPRTRGTHCACCPGERRHRFIPAYTGNTTGRRAPGTTSPVHPRVHGEHAIHGLKIENKDGSSPRTRGTHCRAARHPRPRRFIPAYTGNTFSRGEGASAETVHPRVHGEHACCSCVHSSGTGSSPRTRGTPGGPRRRRPASPVHPRVHGEHCLRSSVK